MKKNILIGGAWPYANYKLHIGHISALLPGDIIARYFRLKGDNVVFVSGTDCHGTPTTITAKKEGVTPYDIAKKYHEFDKTDMKRIGISYDLYAATMDEEHKTEVQRMFKLIYDNNYIYEKEEEQDYCDTCKIFLSDREIEGTCPHCKETTKGDQCEHCLIVIDVLQDKNCSICKKTTVLKNNKHLYFSLSKFQKELEKYINKNLSNWRKNAQNETNKFLKLGLIDRAATRQLDWGVDVPIDGYEDKKIYVWIEAVMGYLTTCKRVCGNDYENFITDSNTISYYIHGKDNIVFHTIIFPALIMAMRNNYNLPNYIISSEYLNMKDEKMSKSKGNLMTLDEMLNLYDADTIRYNLILNGPEKKDVNFSVEDLVTTHNKFLVGVIGNFINRNLSFIVKKFDGIIKEGNIDKNIINKTKELYNDVGNLIAKGELRAALELVTEYAILGNKFYDESEPWIKVKDNIEEFNNITYTCVYMMANLSNLLYPFIPEAANKIKKMLNITNFNWEEINITGDIKINSLELLFNRIE